MKDIFQVIEKIIDKQKTAFISSVDSEGYPNMKAMLSPRKRDGLKVFYFSTNTSSMRVKQFRDNPKASIYFCDRRFFKGVMIKGTIEVLEDSASKEMLWKIGDRIYYPKGVTDPDYCVLKFTAQSGRYYNNLKSVNFTIEEK
jgi:general stress protein 26